MLTPTHPLKPNRTSAALSVSLRALIGASLLSSTAGAQVSNATAARPSLADSSVSVLMRLARRGRFPDEAAVEILRQVSRAYPESKRRELADSIADFVIALPGSAISAVGVIEQWGTADQRLSGQADAIALGYLIRISRNATDAETRMGAIRGMAFQVKPGRALPYMTEVAGSARRDEAPAAVSELSRLGFSGSVGTSEERAEAANVLRHLYDTGAMKSGGAISVLCDIAGWQRWPPKAMCTGRA